MTTNEKQFRFTRMVGKLIVHAEMLGLDLSLRECWRSKVRQVMLKATGKSKTLASFHRKALAVDFVLFRNGSPVWDSGDSMLVALGEYWESMGGVWGGRWGWDGGHFQYGP